MPTAARPARVDAVRNRALLLAAAEAEFAERGLDVSIADIARRAGVAKGTVFRHFATKDALVAAVAGDRLARLVAVARSLADAPDSGAALREFLSATAEILQHQGLTFLRTVSECDPVVAEIHDRLLASAGVLVDRAHRDGLVRPDVTGADVLLLTCATVHTVGALSEPGSDLWRRYLTIVVDGLRPEGASPLPRPPPSGSGPHRSRRVPPDGRDLTASWCRFRPFLLDPGRVPCCRREERFMINATAPLMKPGTAHDGWEVDREEARSGRPARVRPPDRDRRPRLGLGLGVRLHRPLVQLQGRVRAGVDGLARRVGRHRPAARVPLQRGRCLRTVGLPALSGRRQPPPEPQVLVLKGVRRASMATSSSLSSGRTRSSRASQRESRLRWASEAA